MQPRRRKIANTSVIALVVRVVVALMVGWFGPVGALGAGDRTRVRPRRQGMSFCGLVRGLLVGPLQVPDAGWTGGDYVVRQVEEKAVADDPGLGRKFCGEAGGVGDRAEGAIQDHVVLVGAGVLAVRDAADADAGARGAGQEAGLRAPAEGEDLDRKRVECSEAGESLVSSAIMITRWLARATSPHFSHNYAFMVFDGSDLRADRVGGLGDACGPTKGQAGCAVVDDVCGGQPSVYALSGSCSGRGVAGART